MSIAPDQKSREQALNYSESFIVQAPAGSGKTELLTQRYLVLLAKAQRVPEEVLAITFTKKAATEMRARIMHALDRGMESEAPVEAHAKLTWSLAQAVLKRDKEANWNLQANSHRLRVTTIDALCANITQQLPLMARFGDSPFVSENAQHLYQAAVSQLLKDLGEKLPWQDAIATVLLHLDNRIDLFEKLLVGMLQRREQWLDVLPLANAEQDLRAVLEQSMQDVIAEALSHLSQAMPMVHLQELSELLFFAWQNLSECNVREESIAAIKEASEFSRILRKPDVSDLPLLINISELLLTQEHQWRKSIDKRNGFPAKNKEFSKEKNMLSQSNKERMLSLLEAFGQLPSFRSAFVNIRNLPPFNYTESQWHIVDALLVLLPVLVAHLRLVFAEYHTVDFNEVALSALHALGTDEAPTELALSLDYQIRHVLLDEFQDTSQLQYRLLEALTRGWQKDDGRTLFLVGDPMQSIYRFRQADVGLFMRVKEQGINSLRLQYLCLQANFRSTPAIVDWVNLQFPKVFPAVEDHLRGAVSYSASVAVKPMLQTSSVNLSNLYNATAANQAEEVVKIVINTLKDHPLESIAILVRSRAHLDEILPYLQAANIAFCAVDIESLAERAIIQDLLSLSYALSHLHDRLSWLAILRAPWCGLPLADLYCIAKLSLQSSVYEVLLQSLDKISALGAKILSRVIPVLANALSLSLRVPLRSLVEKTWWALGGPSCLVQPYDIHNAELFFELLEREEEAGAMPARKLFLQQLQNLKARNQTSPDARVQVMTIHKSKGLEFDTVIIPGLCRGSRPEDQPMLLWQQTIDSAGRHRLLLAPIKKNELETDPMYQFLYGIEQEKSLYEGQRLLYVAVTRAKKRLNLVANCVYDFDKKICKTPPKRSLMGYLWPALEAAYQTMDNVEEVTAQPLIESIRKVLLQRLPSTWESKLTPFKTVLARENSDVTQGRNIPEPYVAQLSVQRAIGKIIHQYLAEMSVKGLAHCKEEHLPVIQKQLQQLGVSKSILAKSASYVLKVLTQVMEDPRGRWILAPHQGARSEYALLSTNKGSIQKLIIDRTFIDENGLCWVIDYKSSQPEPDEPLEVFLAREKAQYISQLTAYAKVLAKLDVNLKRIACALYFPVIGAWIEWMWLCQPQE